MRTIRGEVTQIRHIGQPVVDYGWTPYLPVDQYDAAQQRLAQERDKQEKAKAEKRLAETGDPGHTGDLDGNAVTAGGRK